MTDDKINAFKAIDGLPYPTMDTTIAPVAPSIASESKYLVGLVGDMVCFTLTVVYEANLEKPEFVQGGMKHFHPVTSCATITEAIALVNLIKLVDTLREQDE